MDKRESILSTITQVGRKRRVTVGNILICFGNRSTTRTEERIRRTLVLWVGLRGYCDNTQDIDELARQSDASIYEVREFFSRRIRKRFLTIRKELRMSDAAEMIISHPEMTLMEIGKSVGMGDKSDFRRAFHSLYGCTPKEWREMHLSSVPPQEESHSPSPCRIWSQADKNGSRRTGKGLFACSCTCSPFRNCQ